MPSIALYCGLSGLQAHAAMMDVVGNNLSNENTTGFKAERATFQDLVYQTVSAGSGPSGKSGGTNPEQLGFGVGVGSIDSFFQQGALNPTGRDLDFALDGTGFFVLNNGSQEFYTRDGAFTLDAAGFLVDSANGFRVQRFGVDGEDSATEPGFQIAGNSGVRIPYGAVLPGAQTQNVTVAGNISATLPVGETSTVAISVFDSQGTERALNVTFEKTAADTYSVAATMTGATVSVPATSVTFGADGTLAGPATLALSITGLSAPQTITLNLGTIGATTGLTQFGGATTAAAILQDGSSAASLASISVETNGTVQGVLSNGKTIKLAQLALASFANPEGLVRVGDNNFASSSSSGPALIGPAESRGRGAVRSRALEGSNVDLALELSKLIIAQRGFQVNTRTIAASNQIEQDLTSIIQ